jgi:aspartate ammonia-lyase
VESATASVTALVEELGYSRATDLIHTALQTGKSIRELVVELGLMDAARFDELVAPERVTRLGSPGRPPRTGSHSGVES